MKKFSIAILLIVLINSCKKSDSGNTTPPPVTPPGFSFNTLKVNGQSGAFTWYNQPVTPVVKISFTAPVNKTTVSSSITLKTKAGAAVAYNATYENSDSTIIIQPAAPLSYLTAYLISAATTLKSAAGGSLLSGIEVNLVTAIDSTDKFPVITDEALLTKVQQQTFKYFWDFAHPTSGLARERNTSGDVVTTGGSGFGIMAIITAISRNFITRAEGLARIQKIATFLKTKATTYHGAYAHWINGATGATVPFSTKDDGADLVETSYLMQGLLTARQYFNTSDASETTLRADINSLYNNVEWSWFRKNNLNILYWHWSNTYQWDMNLPIKGWNESLITYVLAASSTTNTIPKATYDSGWAGNGSMKNNSTYYNIQLPLGPAYGGPLFFTHYSFLGINPTDLTDAYANYFTQNKNHTLINYNYCKANPKSYYGYSNLCWGLTASDIAGGYTASSPTNDVGVIAPTAALSSFPYTPTESMQALKFFYYKLGDKIWKDDGFVDAFSLHDQWFADSYLAIDQGPIIIMIENYRSQLLWNLFMSCPEVKTGMTKLGFSSPHL